MSQPLMKQADGQGPDHTLRRHLAWSGPPPPAARARAEADALLSALHHTRRITVTPRAADDVSLVVSELIANAAQHAPGPGRLEVQAAEHGRLVRVTVWDTSPALPQSRPADPHRVGGHGLEIVTALSSRLSVQHTGEGKLITAEIPLHQARPPDSPGQYYIDGAPDGTVR
ncbi:ATP-binding protein [Streptomyces sp. b94]|uniref:ATP-binding protein n=1 Tax=Streptomyces sp. b94 TaxID=1827634 RepID=UPI001B39B89B|nr:ATP-binding protein [Streptomyces sp. b94]MBQ1098255.1 ATP-binding protein [Streptomyces sp. b94]